MLIKFWEVHTGELLGKCWKSSTMGILRPGEVRSRPLRPVQPASVLGDGLLLLGDGSLQCDRSDVSEGWGPTFKQVVWGLQDGHQERRRRSSQGHRTAPGFPATSAQACCPTWPKAPCSTLVFLPDTLGLPAPVLLLTHRLATAAALWGFSTCAHCSKRRRGRGSRPGALASCSHLLWHLPCLPRPTLSRNQGVAAAVPGGTLLPRGRRGPCTVQLSAPGHGSVLRTCLVLVEVVGVSPSLCRPLEVWPLVLLLVPCSACQGSPGVCLLTAPQESNQGRCSLPPGRACSLCE